MKYSLPVLTAVFLLTACATGTKSQTQMTLNEHLENPLFAERYAKMMVGRMTELEIRKDPLLEDTYKREVVENTKREWMEADRAARKKQHEGLTGEFVGDKEYARGRTLLLEYVLYFSSDFETDPGPALHLYLSESIDPHDVDFPDETSTDLGLLQSPYGAQRYDVPQETDVERAHTVVLWDMELERLYGFAQISP